MLPIGNLDHGMHLNLAHGGHLHSRLLCHHVHGRLLRLEAAAFAAVRAGGDGEGEADDAANDDTSDGATVYLTAIIGARGAAVWSIARPLFLVLVGLHLTNTRSP